MNEVGIIEEFGISPRILDDKKEQTTKKIEYIRAYVKEWLYVWVNQDATKSVTFIDAMCNAGIYSDGDLGTAAEVAMLFAEFAKDHGDIHFNLFLNDLDEARLNVCREICERYTAGRTNVFIRHTCMDVSDFLRTEARATNVPSGHGNAIILFVDPYNAGTVHLNAINAFTRSRYCELLFNWFSSDWNRNKQDERVNDCLDGVELVAGENPTRTVAKSLKVGDMKYAFSYEFRTVSNVAVYQIIFLTPSAKGLEKLKEALWSTFHGEQYHRNHRRVEVEQLQLFGVDFYEEQNVNAYALDAREDLLDEFNGASGVPYSVIAAFILERTLMKESQILEHVLKPLIERSFIHKDGRVRKQNYKADTYSFVHLD